MVEQKGEFVAMPQARSQTMHYMKGLKGAANLRRYCCTLTHLEDLDELIDALAESQDYIILLMKKRYVQPLDKRTLTGGTVEEFKRFLEEKIGKTFRRVK